MKNRLEKFLITLTSFLFLAVIVMLLKIQGDSKKLQEIKENLNNYLTSEPAKEIPEQTTASEPDSDTTLPSNNQTTTNEPGLNATSSLNSVISEPAPVPATPDKKTRAS